MGTECPFLMYLVLTELVLVLRIKTSLRPTTSVLQEYQNEHLNSALGAKLK